MSIDARETAAHAPVAPAAGRAVRVALLAATLCCAACGLVYELALVALGSYLLGDAVVQASIVLSVMVFAMGLGSLAAKPLLRVPLVAFAAVELVLGVLGGLSVLTLYAAFAWLQIFQPVLVATALVLGLLVGAEIPLLMALLQRIRRQEAASAVADLVAADYVGALVGGLAFPFLLLPLLGQIRGALVVGVVNILVGALVLLVLLRRWSRPRVRLVVGLATVVALAVLGTALAAAGRFEVTARQALYDDPVVHAERSRYQDIVVTESAPWSGVDDVRLFLNGDLQFSSMDEYRYHEALVHPVMAGPHARVLVLGGGDGLALREVLRYPDVQHATLVDLDPAVVRLARTDPRLARLNHHSFADPRVRYVAADAFTWARSAPPGGYDVVIVDFPDPDEVATAKLYSAEFYALARHLLAPGGRMVVQAGSTYFAPRSFWTIDASVRAGGLQTVPYHVDVPTFGEWGFVLASASGTPALHLGAETPPLRFLTPAVLQAGTVFPADRAPLHEQPSTLDRPRILDLERQEWKGY